MSERLFDYHKVEITGEPKLHLVPIGLEDRPELAKLITDFEAVSEEFLPISSLVDYSTAELLIPAFTDYLQSIDTDESAEAQLAGVIVTQVVQLTGAQPSVIASVTFAIDVDQDEDDDEEEEAENWD